MMAQEKMKQFRGTAPYFVVRNLMESLQYYHQVLGFDMPPLWGAPPTFAMPSRDGFTFMIKEAEQGSEVTTSRHQSGFWDAYIWINDADVLFAEYKNNGAIIDYEPCIQEDYDMKEFGIRDPDGHLIGFGQHFEGV